jgi:hypothetical protein
MYLAWDYRAGRSSPRHEPCTKKELNFADSQRTDETGGRAVNTRQRAVRTL